MLEGMWLALGLSVGVVLGMTGSGGAVLALPLLRNMGQMSLSAASVAVLPIVTLSALMVGIPKWRQIRFDIVGWMLLVAIPTTYLVKAIKHVLPEAFILSLILAIVAWGLWQTWRPAQIDTPLPQTKRGASPARGLVLGAIMGALTASTGLGGGILLTPLLRKHTGLDTDAATASSIGVIAGISVIAFSMQYHVVSSISALSWTSYGLLGAGLLLANLLTTLLGSWCTKGCFEGLRKIVYTGVLVITVVLLV